MGRRVKMMLGSAYDGWRPGVKEGGVYYDGDPSTTEKALIVTGLSAPGNGRDLGREKRVLLSLQHQNVMRLLSLALAPGRSEPVYAYAFYEGISLARLMRALRAERGLLPWGVVVAIVADVARAATAAGGAASEYPGFQVFHEGPTPDDILVDAVGMARVAGFEVWREGSVARSSPGYGPPEGSLGETGLAYSLGALLVEMLSGERPPQSGRTPDRHRDVIRRVQVKVLARPGDRLPQGLVEVVADCLEYEPRRRPTLKALTERLAALARRAPPPGLMRWCARVVPSMKTGEPLTESVMAADPRHGLGPVAGAPEEADPDFRPTTIDPERAARQARLDAALLPMDERDSMHGIVTRVGESLPSPVWEPDADVALTEPLGARTQGTQKPKQLGPSPAVDSITNLDHVSLVQPAPEIASEAPARAPERLPASRPEPPPPPVPASAGTNPLLIPIIVLLVVLALALGWIARDFGDSSPGSPLPGPEAAPAAATPRPEPPSAPTTEASAAAPVEAAPEQPAPTPAAAPPAASKKSTNTPSARPTSPSRPAAPPTSAPTPEPAPPEPPPEAPPPEPSAPPATFQVVFRSADPTITNLSVKCHQGDSSGTGTIVVDNAGPGPCRVTGQRGPSPVSAIVPIDGPRTYTCFAGGSRGCR